MADSFPNSNFDSSRNKSDEINLLHIRNIIFRNKLLIGSIGLISLVLSILYAFSIKKLWEGEFQIVLQTEQSVAPSLNINPNISKFVGVTGPVNDINTEVGILKSSSLLKPIYIFANDLNKRNEKINFREWKNKLKIELEKGTTILNIVYRDNDRENIIPVLEKMSNSYQEYSGRDKKRNLKLTEKYLINQISIFKDKSTNSIKAAQEFAIEQDLLVQQNSMKKLNLLRPVEKDNPVEKLSNVGFMSNIGIENERVKAANQIRKIDLQIKKINEMNDDLEGIKFIAYSVPTLRTDKIIQSLGLIEEELILTRVKYKEQSQAMKKIEERRDVLMNLLKKRIIGYLEAQKMVETSKMEAALRPKGIITMYKKLIREAESDELTLISLENELRMNRLESQKLSDPWQLVTNPTLGDYPLAPNKKRIEFFGFIIGLLAGLVAAFYKERKSGIIFDSMILEESLSCKILETINKNDIKLKSNKISLIKELIFAQSNKSSIFIVLGDIKKNDFDCLDEFYIDLKSGEMDIDLLYKDFKIDENFINKNIILITSLGVVNFDDINDLNKRLHFINSKINGIILYEKEL